MTTFFGRIKFDSRGINTFKPMVVEQIQDGKHHTVFPANLADAKPQRERRTTVPIPTPTLRTGLVGGGSATRGQLTAG